MGTRTLRAAAKLQAEFYRRYESIAPHDAALSQDDRLIQLIGEFEADVNNGGFGQYLGNKGEARARDALTCLSAIGASRTARWLAAALEGPGGAEGLGRLDEQYYEKAKDLASLAMRHIKRSK